VGIFPEGGDSGGDHGLGRLVEFGFKGPPGTTSSSITTHIIGKSVTLLPCPGWRTTKSTRTCGGKGKKKHFSKT